MPDSFGFTLAIQGNLPEAVLQKVAVPARLFAFHFIEAFKEAELRVILEPFHRDRQVVAVRWKPVLANLLYGAPECRRAVIQ